MDEQPFEFQIPDPRIAEAEHAGWRRGVVFGAVATVAVFAIGVVVVGWLS